ncbi:MAG: beta-lactamase family protein, partial [Acidobacteriia bacterium]|nr:beta-lactamase family protein [Terriglobia bacterium]
MTTLRQLLCSGWLLLALPALPADLRIQRIETGLAGRMRHYATPGLSIAVVDGGRIAWAHGYGVLQQTRSKPARVTARTLFQMASISKPVASIGALRMVERGELSLDEDVNAKLSSWKLPSNDFTARQPVTLRRLLTHTAGIRSGQLPGYTASEPLPSLLDALRGGSVINTPLVRVDFLPGSRCSYSNGGFLVVQQLMSDAAHKPFPDLMRQLVLKRAGMKRSTYRQPLPDKWKKEASSGHRITGKPIPGRWHAFPEQAAVGLWSTPSDLARLAIELSRAFNGQSRGLISQSMAQEMFRRQAGGFGLAWLVDGEGDSLSFR